jgi:hypothetical protein
MVCLFAVAAPACGGDEPPSGDGGTGATASCMGRFMPLKLGIKWSYLVRDTVSQSSTMKVQTVEPMEAVPMKPAARGFRVKTEKGVQLSDLTVSWQEDTGKAVVRHQEDSYRPGTAGAAPTLNLVEFWDPSKIRLDESPEHLRAGTTWSLSYMETSVMGATRTMHPRTEKWTVVGVNEEVSVPAGTYTNTLHVRREGTDQGASSRKDYWYGCNVGKLRETGGQVEQLQKVEGL